MLDPSDTHVTQPLPVLTEQCDGSAGLKVERRISRPNSPTRVDRIAGRRIERGEISISGAQLEVKSSTWW